MLREHIDFGQRRADDIIDDAAERAQLVNIVELADLHHVAFVFEAA